MSHSLLFMLLAAAMIASEISAREAIKPAADVGQIFDELGALTVTELHERGPPCTLDVQKDLPLPNQVQPLYLRPNTADYWLPNAKGQLQIQRGASIELYCSKSFANGTDAAALQVPPNTRSILLRCLYGFTFEWLHGDGGKHQFRHFTCSQALRYSVDRLDSQPCGGSQLANAAARLYRVGYNISGERFVSTMEICHDATQLRTHYTHHQLLPASIHYQRNVKRIDFSQAGHFVGFDMQQLYSQRHQLQQLQLLLQQSTANVLDEKAGFFLTRGHLAAKADLIYASQQRSSFTYMNVAPQWQSFNGGQWLAVEDETRKFVARSRLNVSVFTGTWDVMPLPADSAAGAGFYLASDANNNAVLPVPRLYYRVLIDKAHPWRGIALVGVNNPHATLSQILDAYVICEPVHESVSWLRWIQNRNLRKGYLYACAVSDLAQAVGQLPLQLNEVHELLV